MMTDQMKFPDTWEEFEEHYGFYDIKNVYTFGNLRLIPSFRVQQWLDHLEVTRNDSVRTSTKNTL